MSINRITWLFLYQDRRHAWHTPVITLLPQDTGAGAFKDENRAEDWQGHFLKAYLYQGYTKASTLYSDEEINCTETDCYAWYTYDGVKAGCDYT